MNNQTVNDLNNRNLDSCYFSIICFPTKIYFKDKDDNVNQKTLYIFYGCNMQGARRFITACISDNFIKVSDWYNFFLTFKKRNLEVVLYANIPNNKIMKEALLLAFANVEIVFSCFEPINKIFKYLSDSYVSNVFTIIKNLYLSNDINEYNLALNTYNETFGSNKFLIDLLENDISKIKNYYKYDLIIRKHIFAFFFSRDTIKKLKMFSHSKPYFTSVDEYLNLMLDFIKKSESRMYSSKVDWVELINFIYDSKKDLIKCYL